ncbi:MAG: bifunctional hydroxymethylpyrimidine kinase/phosphomethylpyrimidine kinase [Anaerolineae bacterium]
MRRALTIAGSDSGGGAGIQADLKTFAALGVYGMSALTAITAQNTVGVQGVYELPADFVGLQIDSVVTDIGVDAVKTGMLANAEIIAVVAAKVQEHHLPNLVVDPVMVAKSGDPLLREDARDALIRLLLPLAFVVTPNLYEARVLTGMRIESVEDMKRAAAAIHAMGPRYVVVKGGHLTGDSVDVLYDGHDYVLLSSPRIETRNTHGTGCTFASAIAAGLAKGLDGVEAVREAKRYITTVLRYAPDLGRGHGPVHHFAALYQKAGEFVLEEGNPSIAPFRQRDDVTETDSSLKRGT